MFKINAIQMSWPIAGSFRIAHGTVKEIQTVQVHISDGLHVGRGECRPYARYDETPQSTTQHILSISAQLCTSSSSNHMHTRLQTLLPAGAARNAVDCALWDLKAKQSGLPVWKLLNLPQPNPRTTAFTLSIDSPARMAQAARQAKNFPILKLKIAGFGGLDACLAVLQARPDAQLIIDANESLSVKNLKLFRKRLADAPVLLIEQPLKAADFDKIDNSPNALPILCADESLHTHKELAVLWQAGYRAVNVKLDKCGGLSEAHKLMETARNMGFLVMAGCMVGTSLAMAPMMALEHYADFIDLDGPLLLAQDIEHGLHYEKAVVHPPTSQLWG